MPPPIKTVLILSAEDDKTTDDVLDWLYHYSIPVIRINGSNALLFKDLSIVNDQLICSLTTADGEVSLNIQDIASFWYRRGKLSFAKDYLKNIKDKHLQSAANESIDAEFNELSNFLYRHFKSQKSSIGSIFHNRTNKLYNLRVTEQKGLSIPDTLIATSKEQLLSFSKKHFKILTKPIGQAGLLFENNEFVLDGLSTLIDVEEIEKLPNHFPPSLFQSYVEKAYELRIFYLDGICYSSVIFSQLDERTKVDFRNYNHEHPNRVVPYQLPDQIEKSIKSLMSELGMKSGSLDVIVTPKKEYVFLEVNPIGQFFQVSFPCNYYLEKEVAKYLSKPFHNE